MFFEIDIDQTISTGFRGQTLGESIGYYRDRGLYIPDTITDLHDLFQLPEVMKIHEVLDGAVEGVKQLTQLGSIGYLTVRKHQDEATNEEIQRITRSWLETKGFPFSHSVVFCRSSLHKLVVLSEQMKSSEEPVWLIDDRWWKLLEAFVQLAANKEYSSIADELRNRLTLVAFGVSSLSGTPEIPVFTLPSWLHISNLITECSLRGR